MKNQENYLYQYIIHCRMPFWQQYILMNNFTSLYYIQHSRWDILSWVHQNHQGLLTNKELIIVWQPQPLPVRFIGNFSSGRRYGYYIVPIQMRETVYYIIAPSPPEWGCSLQKLSSLVKRGTQAYGLGLC